MKIGVNLKEGTWSKTLDKRRKTQTTTYLLQELKILFEKLQLERNILTVL